MDVTVAKADGYIICQLRNLEAYEATITTMGKNQWVGGRCQAGTLSVGSGTDEGLQVCGQGEMGFMDMMDKMDDPDITDIKYNRSKKSIRSILSIESIESIFAPE